MTVRTTCIGAYPKPEYLALPDWFNLAAEVSSTPTLHWQSAVEAMGDDANKLIERAVADVINDQVSAGIDIPTDGEVARENYIHYHCRHLHGIDFTKLNSKSLRGGAYTSALPTVKSKVAVNQLFLHKDWQRAQRYTNKPVKITMPGPMTVSDTVYNDFYKNPLILENHIADALNAEVLNLARAGCRHIQIDEPLFARYTDRALEYGIENLERAFHNCPESVTRTVHMCCGYPDKLDDSCYEKADPQSYNRLAGDIDSSTINAVSIEDAHRHNDLKILEKFKRTTVILGVVAIASSKVETVEQIQLRLQSALDYIEPERLMAAPDCGLGMLPGGLVIAKLKNLCEAARSI